MAREIPGFWHDPKTGKYFKIGDGFTPPKPKPKTLAELYPINYKPINRNPSQFQYTKCIVRKLEKKN